MASVAHAKLELPLVFSDHMVLQRNQPVPVWGKTTPGARVKLIFGRNIQVKETVAGSDGSFKIWLDPMSVNGIGETLRLISGDTLDIIDAMVGEVWLCSGQSNMEYTMNKSGHYANARRSQGLDSLEITKLNDPMIRLFLVNRDLTKPSDRNKGWQLGESPWVGQFSAAGYYFAREMVARLKVPVGIIAASVSGSAIEPWLPARSIMTTADQLAPTQEAAGKFFTGLIEPLAPFALKGFLWYQGETNCMMNQRQEYTRNMQLLIFSWRGLWNSANLPFYYVQLPPFYYSHSKGKLQQNERSLAFFREAQDKVMSIMPNTGRIITTDLADNLEDIHPTYKWEIGKRLAWLALDKTYHIDQVSSGPQINEVNFNKKEARVDFVNPKLGLVVRGGSKITGFELAGADGQFYPATAVVKKKRYVIVTSSQVTEPVALRFAWKEDAQPNLFNNAGLPAEPYRTDHEPEPPVKSERRTEIFRSPQLKQVP